MAQAITIQPAEQGSAIVTILPVDEDGVALVFGQLASPAWQLMEQNGTVINDRTFVLCPLTSLTFVLKGDDLAMFGALDSGIRVLSFQALYDSTAGDDLPVKAECKFRIDKMLGQTDN